MGEKMLHFMEYKKIFIGHVALPGFPNECPEAKYENSTTEKKKVTCKKCRKSKVFKGEL
jgi:hypothetical protein